MDRTRGLSRRTRLGILGALVGALALAAALFSGRSGSGAQAVARDGSFAIAMPPSSEAAPGRASAAAPARAHGPTVALLRKGRTFKGDVRRLPRLRPALSPGGEGAESESHTPSPLAVRLDSAAQMGPPGTAPAPAPAASVSFAGLDCKNVTGNSGCAALPPDTFGEVGPEYYVQTVNTSVGIFTKSGSVAAAFTFPSLWAAAGTGTPCDTYTAPARDPQVVYDSAADRWLLLVFASTRDATGAQVPPFYECFAVSRTGDPVTGGWNFYSLLVPDRIPDYQKIGIWPDGLYMTGNMVLGGSFANVRLWALNKSEMEAGAPTHAQSFDLPFVVDGEGVINVLPSTYHTVTGAPPAGRPNLMSEIGGPSGNRVVRVWKFHVDWSNPALSTLSAPTQVKAANWTEAPARVPAKNGNDLWTLGHTEMAPAQYVNLGGTEALWVMHGVASPGNSTLVSPRWYQLNVSGGTIATKSPLQQSTWAPDSTLARWMPSLAVDKLNDMAIGYSVTSSSIFPGIRYAGRLATDSSSTLGRTERSLIEGTASTCCTFPSGKLDYYWGDYSSMAIDPNGCDFWYTNEYFLAPQPTTLAENNWLTRIGSFRLNPSCVPTKFASTLTADLASGVSGGTVTLSATLKRASVSLSGKTVAFTRNGASVGSAVTDASGVATLPGVSLAGIAPGTYAIGATFAGDAAYISSAGSSVLTVG
jgi:hypothetical protein